METIFPPSSLVERFLFPPSDLPVLGSSALEQILEEDSSSSSSGPSSVASSISEDMDPHRMSPDSTEDRVSEYYAGGSSDSGVPDSTTNVVDYDSDAFDSDDSRSSLAELNYIHPSFPPDSSFLLPQQHPALYENQQEQQHHHQEPQDMQQQQAMMVIGNGESSPKKKKKKTKRAGDAVLRCDLCEYSTRYKEHLTSHMNTHVSERNFMCSDCGQTFKWGHSLKRHQRTHQAENYKKFACRFCHKSFSRKDHLTIHEGLHSESSVSYPCRICGATFKNKKTLSGHVKTHNAEKGFKCSECDSEFTRRASLNRHVRAAHAGHVILCPMCPSVFSYRSTLEDHKKAVHNEGRREFGCQLCGVQFAVKAYLSKHMVTCKNRAAGRTFGCESCSKSFPTKRHLQDHLKRKHFKKTEEYSNHQGPFADGYAQSLQYQCRGNIPFDDGLGGIPHAPTEIVPSVLPGTPCEDPLYSQSLHQEHHREEENNVGSLLRLVYNTVEPQTSHQQYPPYDPSSNVVMDTSYQTSLLDGLPLDCL